MATSLGAAYGKPSAKPPSLRLVPSEVVLRGTESSQTFLVMGTFEGGLERDLTSQAEFSLSNPDLAQLSPLCRVTPRADGDLLLRARVDGQEARATIRIVDAQAKRPLSFAREVGTILTRSGCNDTTCHGAVPGQGGFKLSLNASYPRQDYKWIVQGGKFQVLTDESSEPRKPRIDLEAPEKSLLLLKPTLQVSHGGGRRFGADSPEYARILQWIRQRAPYGPEGESETPWIEKLEVYPRQAVLDPKGRQQILVTAHLSNGQREDVTHRVVYESGDEAVLKVSQEGLVRARRPGETSVLIRAPGQVASARFGVLANRLISYPRVPERNFIDRFVFGKLGRLNMVPSDLSSDEEFLRRVCLDLTGTLPPADRVRAFIASPDLHKRDKLIETLLNSPEYEEYLFFRYAEIFRWYGGGRHTQRYGEWLRRSIAENKPYDRLAVERIAAQGYDGPTRFYYLGYSLIPPEDLIAEQVRIYLGRRLDCARCHDHPFEAWSQDQFWGMAAFYGRLVDVRRTLMDDSLLLDSPLRANKVVHPRTKQVVEPRFLDGTLLPQEERADLRLKLAQWMVSHPYFAQALVNRVWDWFFGRGIVDPVDDFRSTNPPTHPELLRALAADFREHGHDLKHLMRVIVRSRTYQLSGTPNETNRGDHLNFSHALPRPLEAAVLLDAISEATGVPDLFKGVPPGTRAISLLPKAPSEFMEIFNRNERRTLPEDRPEPTLAQALHMLTGKTFTEKVSQRGGRVSRLLESGASEREIIEELYLSALSRLPTPEERSQLEEMIGRRPRKQAFEALAWALISSRQFAHNH